jgi:hypothetical protein
LFSGLLFEDLWCFLGLWLLVLSQPSSNWGSELDFFSLDYLCGTLALVLICWVCAMLALVHEVLVALSLDSNLWGSYFCWLGGLVHVVWVILVSVVHGSSVFGSCGLVWFGWSELYCVVFLV